MKGVILVLLLVGFASAADVDFDCPEKIFVGEEFECSVEVFDGDGVYDLKVDLDGERNSILEIWDNDEDEWKSGYYYLTDFVEDGEEEVVRLIVSEAGNYDGVLKLRQGDSREDFDFEMRVRESEKVVDEDEEIVIFHEVDDENEEKKDSVILLNGNVVESVEEKVVYESKNEKVGNYLIYGFALFLIFVIGVLLWDRRR